MTNHSRTSLKRHLISAVTSITLVTFLTLLVFYIYTSQQTAKKYLVEESKAFADMIGQYANNHIVADRHDGLATELEPLRHQQHITNLHIYKINKSTDSIEFFGSYNANDISPITIDKDQIASMKDVMMSENYMDIVRPITFEGTPIGYVYVRSSLATFNALNSELIWSGSALALVLIILASFAAHVFYQTLKYPVDQLNRFIQTVAQERNFSLRAKPTKLVEFNNLGLSLNRLLERTQQQLHKQEEAEAQVLKLNQDLENKVNHRTDALKSANEELLVTLEKLHQFQNQIVENEKMASLGDMVAGIAHEVNTPIGLGVTASSLLSDKILEIKEAFDNKTLKSSQLKRFLNDGCENIDIVYRNLARAADLISSFKQVAVDQSSETNRQFNVSKLLNEVLATLHPELKHSHHNIKIICPDDLVVESKPGPINQVLINLIRNSLIHGFEHIEQGTIFIEVAILGEQMQINYRDNGCGVDEQLKPRIFDPFTTTKRGSGGSGLGMHLVYNLVTQALQGHIQFTSKVDEGVNFIIEFPITKA